MKRAFGCAAFAPVSLRDLRRPLVALPVEALGGRLVRHAFPPHAAFGRERDVGEDACSSTSVAIAFGLVFADVPGATPKKPASGLIARSRPFASGLIQAMSSPTVQTFQPSKPCWRNQHGEIRFAAGAGERRRDVGLLALRILDAEDQHVLGHPAFVARDVRSDAQREAFLAQQRVAAVARTVRPDLARFREMDDVLLFVARPRHILLPGRERRADACACTGTTRLSSLSISAKTGSADARHDAHVDDDVRRIGQLHADLRHRRADRAHAERQHIHRAAAHASRRTSSFSFRRISNGFSQLLVGPAASFESEQMKVRSSTRATSLASERARKQPGHSSSFSLMKVPPSTISAQSWSYSSCEPSTQ